VSLFGTVTVVELATLPARDDAGKIDAYFGAGSAALGVAVLLISPLKVMHDHRWLERRLAAAGPALTPPLGGSASAPGAACARLADAERLLERGARSAAFGKSALIHVGSFAFNLGLGLTLALGFHHVQNGAITATTGVLVSEIQILTQPARTPEVLRRYRAGDLSAPHGQGPRSLAVVPLLGGDRYGLAAALRF
jgi:hypothetical protein